MLNLFKASRYVVLIIFMAFNGHMVSQETISSEEAFKRFMDITKAMDQAFPENDIKTFQRASYSEPQLETYLSQVFQLMDLIPFIEGHHKMKLQTYLHLANWFTAMGLIKESASAYKTFFAYFNDNKDEMKEEERLDFFRTRSFAHSELAKNYEQLHYLDSAAIEHKLNIKLTESINSISYPSAINNYGLFFYWTKKDLDSALFYFEKAYQITERQYSNHILLGSIRDNIADIYSDKGLLEKAKENYGENFKFYQYATDYDQSNAMDVPRLVSAGVQYIETSLKLNDLDDAKKALDRLHSIEKDTIYNISKLPYSKLNILEVEEKFHVANQKFKDAYKVSKEVMRLSDSINKVNAITDNQWQTVLNNIMLDRAKLNFKIDRIQKENKINKQRFKLWISTLVSSLMIILLLSLYLRRRQHLINATNKQLLAEQQLENTDLKIQQLNSDIESKERDMSDFAINLTQNQDWAKFLAEKIEGIKTATTAEKEQLLFDLEKEIQNKIAFDSDTSVFYERLDKLSDAFYRKLTDKFPNLSKNEIRLCSLIRLKMESTHIATLQNITQASLNTSRYRLRKKLELPDDINLDDFIQLL